MSRWGFVVVLLIQFVGVGAFAQGAPAKPSRKIPPAYPSYTPYIPAATETSGSVATDQKEKDKQPPDLSSLLGGGGGAGGGPGAGEGEPRGAASPGDGSSLAGGDPAILRAPPDGEYNVTGSRPDPDFGPPVNGTDYSKASCGNTRSTFITHYGSDPSQYSGPAEARLEGGAEDRHGGLLNSVEEAIVNGRPVSLAGDKDGEFGRRCNRSPKGACLMLVCYNNFDQVFPEYRARFPGVQKNCLIGVIVDTGGAFYGTNGAKIDVATRSIQKARKISGPGRYFEIETETCNRGTPDKRKCEVNNVSAACIADSGSSSSGRQTPKIGVQ